MVLFINQTQAYFKNKNKISFSSNNKSNTSFFQFYEFKKNLVPYDYIKKQEYEERQLLEELFLESFDLEYLINISIISNNKNIKDIYYYDFETESYNYNDINYFIKKNLLDFSIKNYDISAKPFKFTFFTNNPYVDSNYYRLIYSMKKINKIRNKNIIYYSNKIDFISDVYSLIQEFNSFNKKNLFQNRFKEIIYFETYSPKKKPYNNENFIKLNPILKKTG